MSHIQTPKTNPYASATCIKHPACLFVNALHVTCMCAHTCACTTGSKSCSAPTVHGLHGVPANLGAGVTASLLVQAHRADPLPALTVTAVHVHLSRLRKWVLCRLFVTQTWGSVGSVAA